MLRYSKQSISFGQDKGTQRILTSFLIDLRFSTPHSFPASPETTPWSLQSFFSVDQELISHSF